jgi:hypothetical protein
MKSGRSAPILLSDNEMQQLSTALGGRENCWILTEPEFVAETGCPPEELQNWLETGWIQYDIKAVLAGAQKVGPQPRLLVGHLDNRPAVRLFCPTRRLLLSSFEEYGRGQLRGVIASRPWRENAEAMISQVEALTTACSTRELSTIEIKLLWRALWPTIQILLALRDCPYREELKRLHAAVAGLGNSCRTRGSDQSSQAKYAEAQVSARRALGENHTRLLDGFPELLEVSRRICSHELAAYMAQEVSLSSDQFLEMMHMLAYDRAEAATVANPPARIRRALTRDDRRKRTLYRERWRQFTPEQTESLADPNNFESSAIATMDWERAKRDLSLPTDQIRAVEARFEGVNLQAADTSDYLGWDEAHVKAVRRSLEPDRRYGQSLRKRLLAYKRKTTSSK